MVARPPNMALKRTRAFRALSGAFVAAETACLEKLPASVQNLARENYELLKTNPYHPSLHFKGSTVCGRFGSGRTYRALAVDAEDGIVWFWIGTHAEYDRLIR